MHTLPQPHGVFEGGTLPQPQQSTLNLAKRFHSEEHILPQRRPHLAGKAHDCWRLGASSFGTRWDCQSFALLSVLVRALSMLEQALSRSPPVLSPPMMEWARSSGAQTV